MDPIADETQLAYYDWVQNNIRKVEEMSDGQIGYIHIPDMSVAGLDEFTRLFYSQLDKKALIIDDRMNGGGNVSPMILERLQREVYRMNMYRNGSEQLATIPESAHYGPKVCLIDKYSSSDGDLFPYGFRQLGIGKLAYPARDPISTARMSVPRSSPLTPPKVTGLSRITEWIPTSSATSIHSRTISATTPSSTRP